VEYKDIRAFSTFKDKTLCQNGTSKKNEFKSVYSHSYVWLPETQFDIPRISIIYLEQKKPVHASERPFKI